MNRTERIRQLYRERPRSRFLRGSVAALGLLCGYSWLSGQIEVAQLFSSQRASNLQRFLHEDAMPRPLRQAAAKEGVQGAPQESSFTLLMNWASELWSSHGWQALAATFWISMLAMVLAGAYAMLSGPFGARTLMHTDPYWGNERGKRWRFMSSSVRGFAIFLRAIPEYIWAFLLISMIGPSA